MTFSAKYDVTSVFNDGCSPLCCYVSFSRYDAEDPASLVVDIAITPPSSACNPDLYAASADQELDATLGIDVYDYTFRMYVLPKASGAGACDWGG